MTDEELKALVASLFAAQKETDRPMKETDRQTKETDRRIKELGKQIGGLGNKFGDFAEGMAIPSLMEILAKRFGVDQIVETKRLRKIDCLESWLRSRAVRSQMRRRCQRESV